MPDAEVPAPTRGAHNTSMCKSRGGLSDWIELAEEIIVAGVKLAEVADADRENGPQIAGLALLGRSISHMRAIILLIRHEIIVESRIITRSLLENKFLAVALLEDAAAAFKN